jgi:hypothetical protein
MIENYFEYEGLRKKILIQSRKDCYLQLVLI